ncbi:hypothetical protein ACSMX9_11370 [Streptomyces sp. LE64]|uniref:hypothetical protein n=1 Tax=Streptomyces sp. LE64 TaxID=3448653 RepID=UPI0040421655
MPRGRHRHSPPLHRLLPPTVIAGASVLCASGAWFISETALLRGLVAGAAAAAVAGSVVMRNWDLSAGRRVAELRRARTRDEWRFEERLAEVEGELEAARAARGKLEMRLRAKRAELTALRGEHAALLRRYANAETERASALEGHRKLARESTAAPTAVPPKAAPVATVELYRQANEALSVLARRKAAPAVAPSAGTPPEAAPPASPRAAAGPSTATPSRATVPPRATAASAEAAPAPTEAAPPGLAKAVGTAPTKPSAPAPAGPPTKATPTKAMQAEAPVAKAPAPRPVGAAPTAPAATPAPTAVPAPARATPAPAVPADHERAPAVPAPASRAAAVVPPLPPRPRPVTGGFDYFGNKSAPPARPAAGAVRNEDVTDLADVVGEEALALHKAASEAEFKASSEAERGIGQVVDLTAHDETEPIDLHGLRSALRA